MLCFLICQKEIWNYGYMKKCQLCLFSIVPIGIKPTYVELATYFSENKVDLQKVSKFVRIKIPIQNIFDTQAVQTIRALKNKI